MRLSSMLLSVLLVGSVPALSGCSSSDSAAQPAAKQVISKAITAAQGGTVDGPGVKLAIPPGALKADTTVTITITDKSGAPGSDKIAAASVFDFGPDGTTFNAPVALTLDFSSAGGPSGAKPEIAFLKNGAWESLGAATVAGAQVTASTTHFTPFTVVWSGGAQVGGGCAALEFTPCGGDLTGTWKFSAGCADLATTTDPTGGACPSATTALSIDFTGTITFSGGTNYTVAASQTSTVTMTVPKSCLPGGATCAQLLQGSTDDGTACVNVKTQGPSDKTESGTYTTSGTSFSTTKADGDAGTGGSTLQYCVTGSTLSVKDVTADATVIYTATKQ